MEFVIIFASVLHVQYSATCFETHIREIVIRIVQ